MGLQTIAESINEASVTAATLAFQRNQLKIALFVTDVESTVRDLLNRISESTGLTLVSIGLSQRSSWRKVSAKRTGSCLVFPIA